MSRPRVKICGIRRLQDAVLAADLGADFLGFNFHPPSPRYVAPEAAAEIAAALRGRVQLVGVFVNLAPAEVERIARLVGLDLLQFHGDESPATVAPFAARALKAVRVRDRPAATELLPYTGVWGFLLDAYHPEVYGGSGTGWDFPAFAELGAAAPELVRRTFLAGGLAPANVRRVVAAARPWGIDLCSGVEAAPGEKDPGLLARLFAEITIKETADGETPLDA